MVLAMNVEDPPLHVENLKGTRIRGTKMPFSQRPAKTACALLTFNQSGRQHHQGLHCRFLDAMGPQSHFYQTDLEKTVKFWTFPQQRKINLDFFSLWGPKLLGGWAQV